MNPDIGSTEASLALETIERRRRDVIAQINVPAWYWSALAAGWAGIGAIAQFGPAWAVTTATAAFGTAHAGVASRALSGRHGSPLLSIRQDLVTRRVPAYVIGFLLVMIGATVAIALGLHADGSRHATLIAGIVVAALVLSAGPHVMGAIRRRSQDDLSR